MQEHFYKKGEIIGKLTILTLINIPKVGKSYECLCECGQETTASQVDLMRGKRLSCGCLQRFSMIGKRFGKLVVIKEIENNTSRRKWLCECDCGGQRITNTYNLTTNVTKSCGCLVKENSCVGAKSPLYKHGLSRTLEYYIEREHRRRAKILNSISEDFNKFKVLQKFDALGNICIYCGKKDKLTIDHLIPLDKGGSHTLKNIVPCCKSCNSSKKNKIIFLEWKPKFIHPYLESTKKWIEKHSGVV